MRNALSLCVEKCVVVSFIRSRTPVIRNYAIAEQVLQRNSVTSDLGILLDDKFCFTQHYDGIIIRANRTLGLIFNITRDFDDPMCIKTLYCALVRPILEYCSIVPCHHAEIWKNRIESVQRKLTRYALRRLPWNDPSTLPPYESRYLLLGLETLAIRSLFTVCRWSAPRQHWCADNSRKTESAVPANSFDENHSSLMSGQVWLYGFLIFDLEGYEMSQNKHRGERSQERTSSPVRLNMCFKHHWFVKCSNQ